MQKLEKILEEIEEYRKHVCEDYSKSVEFISASKRVFIGIDYIIRKHMNDKDEDGGWIPVEERLPENGESVLCTDGEYIYLVEYDADLDAAFGDMDRIIAWKPLPEPYRQDGNV